LSWQRIAFFLLIVVILCFAFFVRVMNTDTGLVVDVPLLHDTLRDDIDGKPTLRCWLPFSAWEAEWFKKNIFDEFNERNDCRVVVTATPPRMAIVQKLILSCAAGREPDITSLEGPWMINFARGGFLLPLNDLLTEEDRKRFYPACLPAGTVDGINYGYPWKALGRSFAVNVDMFKRAGLVDENGEALVPETWDQLVEFAKKLTIDSKGRCSLDKDFDERDVVTYGYTTPGLGWVVRQYFWMAGATIYRKLPDGRFEAALTEPEEMRAIRNLYNMYNVWHAAGYEAAGAMAGASRHHFGGGMTAISQIGPWNIEQLVVTKGLNFKVCLPPRDVNGRRASNFACDNFVISRRTKYPKLAMKLLREIMSTKNQAAYQRALWKHKAEQWKIAHPKIEWDIFPPFMLSANKEANNIPEFDRYPVNILRDSIQYGRMIPYIPHYQEAEQYFTRIMDRISYNDMDGLPLEEFVERENRKLQEIIDGTGARPSPRHKKIFAGVVAAALALGLFGFFRVRSKVRRLREKEAATRQYSREEMYTALQFVAPNVLLFLAFLVGPLVFAFLLSFSDYKLLKGYQGFMAFMNFLQMFKDRTVLEALWHSFLYAIVVVPVGAALGLCVALVLKQDIAGKNIYRSLLYMPVMITVVAVAAVWANLYEARASGLANWILLRAPVEAINCLIGLFVSTGDALREAVTGGIGLEYPKAINWLGDPAWALWSIMIMAILTGVGGSMIFFLAGLEAIPSTFYEAADIDGANAWQKFQHVTWPLLKPTTFFVLTMGLIGALQTFGAVYMMTHGGPNNATNVIVFEIYRRAMELFDMGLACAMSYILFLIIVTVTLINQKFTGQSVEY